MATGDGRRVARAGERRCKRLALHEFANGWGLSVQPRTRQNRCIGMQTIESHISICERAPSYLRANCSACASPSSPMERRPRERAGARPGPRNCPHVNHVAGSMQAICRSVTAARASRGRRRATAKRREISPMAENWHKRHAIMLASQLPDNASDANAVIRECRTSLIRGCIPRRLPSRPRYLVWSAIRPESAYATQGRRSCRRFFWQVGVLRAINLQ